VVLACTDDSAHWMLSSTVAFATEGCCADQWSDRLEMVEIPGEVWAEEGGRGARGAKEKYALLEDLAASALHRAREAREALQTDALLQEPLCLTES
jgi:hypothetical protein